MIVSRTPFRITLGGGGTDLPSFYERHGGYILALGIDKYMYVTLNVPYADRKIRLHYTQSETVDHIDQLQHELAREALRAHALYDCVEIASLADLPAGTGLGSSSAYLVGLLNVVRAYREKTNLKEVLAQEACSIELDVLKKPIGKQDQYMAAYGGLTELVIDRDGSVRAERLEIPHYAMSEFVSKVHLYYTNVQRSATDLLREQSQAIKSGAKSAESAATEILTIGRDIGTAMRSCDFDTFGSLMHNHWLAKKRLSPKVSVSQADELYDYVRKEFGVLGGKIAGAGGGGFLMLYCPARGAELTEFMARNGMRRLPYAAEFEGSKIITNVMASSGEDQHGPHAAPPLIRESGNGRPTVKAFA